MFSFSLSLSFFSLSLVLIHQYTCLDVAHRKTGTMITSLFYINEGLEYQIREYEILRSFIRAITMVNNTTSVSIDNQQTVTDDSTGAVVFIVFVLLWYSSSILFLMIMQIGRSNERIDGRSKLFVENLRNQSNNTEVLSRVKLVLFFSQTCFLFRRIGG